VEKTNAARLLDARGVAYRVTVYDATRAFHSAEEAATLLGAPPEAVYKTLVVLRETRARAKPMLVMIPSSAQVDLKVLARELGEKSLRMASQREAEALTGLQVGGISALAVRKGAFDVCLDASARGRDRIHVSAGVRGIDLELAVADLIALTGARVVGAAGPEETRG
jgi:Cys-tRNA(Pro)/Cys-tRNA(Cys) deacylase